MTWEEKFDKELGYYFKNENNLLDLSEKYVKQFISDLLKEQKKEIRKEFRKWLHKSTEDIEDAIERILQ